LKRNNKDSNAKNGLSVEVRNNDVNYALRKFKKKIQESGILQELRERQHYTKPSEARKKAKAAGRARWLKKLDKLDPQQAENARNKR
jgi:small subunit ribosomal protein S21